MQRHARLEMPPGASAISVRELPDTDVPMRQDQRRFIAAGKVQQLLLGGCMGILPIIHDPVINRFAGLWIKVGLVFGG